MSIRNYQESQVDLLTTKNLDMKLRRTVNASDAVDPGDYVTKRQTDGLFKAFKIYLSDLIRHFVSADASLMKSNVIPKTGTGHNNLIASSLTDDGAVVNVDNDMNVQGVLDVFDDMNVIGNLTVDGDIIATPTTVTSDQIQANANNAGHIGLLCLGPDAQGLNFDCEFNGSNLTARYSSACNLIKNSNKFWISYASGLTTGSNFGFSTYAMTIDLLNGDITLKSTKLGFFNAPPVIKQTLSGYVSQPASLAYSGIVGGFGTPVYAQVIELNALRLAYENLRVMVEDLRTKLLSSTLVG